MKRLQSLSQVPAARLLADLPGITLSGSFSPPVVSGEAELAQTPDSQMEQWHESYLKQLDEEGVQPSSAA
jgi:hypothetical protein